MILKQSDGHSDDIERLERLKEIAPAAIKSRIDKQIRNFRSGDSGEKSAAHFIDREFGQSDQLMVLHDLRLGLSEDYAQIDHLIIHRLQQTAWVLETKNFTGRLDCDAHGDWTIWSGKKPISIASPVNQAKRQATLLQRWFDESPAATIQKIVPVVLISTSSSVNRKHLQSDANVVKADNFTFWWKQEAEKIGVAKAFGLFGRHLYKGMSPEAFANLGSQLLEAHVPAERDWRATFALPSENSNISRNKPGSQGQAVEKWLLAAETVAAGFPRVIETPHGMITISQLPDLRLALRNEKNDALIDLVRTTCRGRARWNPRYRNWVFDAERLPEIEAHLIAQTREE